MNENLLTTEDAATYLGLGKSTLDLWRTKKTGPKFVRLGDTDKSKVGYRREDLDRWLAEHVEDPTQPGK
jgi:predicted DNA-binding transcriptional regulator AlpA